MPPSNQTTRRTFVTGLVGATAGITGCTGLSGGAGRGGGETPSETPTRSEPDTAVYSQSQDTPTDSPPGTANDIPETPTPTDSPTPTPEEYNQYGYDSGRVTVHYQELRGDVYRYPTVFAAVTNETGQKQVMEIHTEARDSREFIVARDVSGRTVGKNDTWYHPAVLERTSMEDIAFWRGVIISGD